MKAYLLFFSLLMGLNAFSQSLKGIVISENQTIPFATLASSSASTQANSEGKFTINITKGDTLRITSVGFKSKEILVSSYKDLIIDLDKDLNQLNEVVISGTLKTKNLSESITPIEVIHPALFAKSPEPNIFESIAMVNGVRPQVNCNLCNTGDIHINGMEGSYTMILIDGMPIVSGLASVYGLMGIPNSIIERVEIIKGPAATLYGSEAMGGLINIITKTVNKAPKVAIDLTSSSQKDLNLDLSYKAKTNRISNLTGVNAYYFQNRLDYNNDNFTDQSLQNRVSVFNKTTYLISKDKVASLAIRGIYEDRFGGELNWQQEDRGGSEVYGESIQTKRLELISNLPLTIKNRDFTFNSSYTVHDQNSAYGNTPFLANQQIAFAQLFTNFNLNKTANLLSGLSVRNTIYDDNTVATIKENGDNNIQKTTISSIFNQLEINHSTKFSSQSGIRLDYNNAHGFIFTPSLSFKHKLNKSNSLRLALGKGFRVVNVFSEDHAAYTGARDIIIDPNLSPEKSNNINLNSINFINLPKGYLEITTSLFYTYFSNKIVANYEKDDNSIFFENLKEYGITKGVSTDLNFTLNKNISLNLGGTYLNVYQVEDKQKIEQLLTPKFTGNYNLTYRKNSFTVDLTGQITGPMKMPLLANDYRPEYSPSYSIHSLKLSQKISPNFSYFLGIKNITNFMANNTILRANDPFDKHIDNSDSSSPYYNPNNYSFDPTYNYGPMRPRRFYLGVKYQVF